MKMQILALTASMSACSPAGLEFGVSLPYVVAQNLSEYVASQFEAGASEVSGTLAYRDENGNRHDVAVAWRQ